MKSIIFIFAIAIGLSSCEPAYVVNIKNERDDNIQIIFSGDSVIEYGPLKFIQMQNDNYTYELDSKDEVMIYTITNQSLKTDKFPFDTIQIFTDIDTIELNGKDEIFDAFDDDNEHYKYIIVK